MKVKELFEHRGLGSAKKVKNYISRTVDWKSQEKYYKELEKLNNKLSVTFEPKERNIIIDQIEKLSKQYNRG
jgi:DNA polymerase II large subunit